MYASWAELESRGNIGGPYIKQSWTNKEEQRIDSTWGGGSMKNLTIEKPIHRFGFVVYGDPQRALRNLFQ